MSGDDALQLARWACAIEDHYSLLNQHYTPMDIEWAKDGVTGQLWILQARPETIQSQKRDSHLKTYVLKEKSRILVEGRSVGERLGQGKVRVIHNVFA